MVSGKKSGVYKDGRPVSFMFIPSAGYKLQVMNKVPDVCCKRFGGSTIEGLLEHPELFRERTQRACVIAGFSVGVAVRYRCEIPYGTRSKVRIRCVAPP